MPDPATSESPRQGPAPAKLRRLIGRRPAHVTAITVAALAVGVLEAVFLVIASRTALAIASGDETVQVTRGLRLSVLTAIGVAVIVIVLRLVANLAGVRASLGLAYRISAELRTRLAHRFIDADWSSQRAKPAGTLQLLLVQYPEQIASLVVSVTASLAAAVSLLGLLVAAVVVDPASTLVIVGSLAAMYLVLSPLRKKIAVRTHTALEHQARFADSAAEMGQLTLELRTFGREEQAKAHIDGLVVNYLRAQWRTNIVVNAVSPVYVFLGYLAVLFALAAVADVGSARLASVGAVMLIMLRSLGYGQQVQYSSTVLAQVGPMLDHIEQTTDALEPRPVRHDAAPIDTLGSIELRDVVYRYPESNSAALNGVSLRIEPGEAIGIVGPSGGGKSTLVQVLLGLLEPSSGVVNVGDVPLERITRASWTSLVSFVPQEPALLTGTVADNLAFFRPGISTEALERACRAAHLWSEIQQMPEGLATPIGPTARRLSGGQRQRLAIARALVGAPQLLILDEPTSALDVDAETAIREALADLKGQVTIVVVAHRLSTLSACDRIAVMADGRIDAVGTPADLNGNSAFYRRMVDDNTPVADAGIDSAN